MNAYKKFLIILALFLGLNAHAQLPNVQYSGGLAYITGGIGGNESEAIEADAKNWPLMIQLSQIDQKGWGTWISGVRLKVLNDKKEEIFNVVCEGPFVLLRLSPGSYVIDATYDGVVQQKNISLKKSQSEKLSIYWK